MDSETAEGLHGDLGRVLVIDLEATCWRGPQPPGQEPEVIEVGNAILHVGHLHVEPGPELLVQPTRSTVSGFCTELTGLTQEMLEEAGLSFPEALDALGEAYGDLRTMAWASYGDYDRRKLMQECEYHGVPFPFGGTHTNVKRELARMAGWRREVGMAGAMRRLGLDPVPGSRHHRGADDAVNIARLLALVLGGLRA
jgi:inhibitor of KinA sporulation pathway (predicted exonuclease)